jgi:hypothetical protein
VVQISGRVGKCNGRKNPLIIKLLSSFYYQISNKHINQRDILASCMGMEVHSKINCPVGGTNVVPRYRCCTEVHMLYRYTDVVPGYKCYTEVQMFYRGTDVVPWYKWCTREQMLYRVTNVVFANIPFGWKLNCEHRGREYNKAGPAIIGKIGEKKLRKKSPNVVVQQIQKINYWIVLFISFQSCLSAFWYLLSLPRLFWQTIEGNFWHQSDYTSHRSSMPI